jgi:hypothetical protein
MNHSSISWAQAPPSPLLSPFNVFTSTSKPLMPDEAAHILLDLGREIHRDHPNPFLDLFSSEGETGEGLTGTGVAITKSHAALLNVSTSPIVTNLHFTWNLCTIRHLKTYETGS